MQEDADAMVMTAVMLNSIAFSMIDSTEPANTWPNVPDLEHLQWLSIRRGIETVMEATQQWHENSLFKVALDSSVVEIVTSVDDHRPGTVDIPEPFVQLCNLKPESTSENNPYHGTLRSLFRIPNVRCTRDTVLFFLRFHSSLEPQFLVLLERRDAVALLILCYWYALICDFKEWWIYSRASIECTAICIYLENHADDRIVEMLHFPAKACGYSLRNRKRMRVMA